MAKVIITEKLKGDLKEFLDTHRKPELVSTYLHFVEKRFGIKPVVFPPDKLIYQSAEDAIKKLEVQGKVWRETEIKIGFSNLSVNDETQKIYICPFTGKVFGDNTHPNPQDAIYDWVSRCKENTERSGGLPVKRFYVSEDPEVIKSYIPKTSRREAVSKVVYSSVMSGKLYHSKAAVIENFIKSYLKGLSLVEVQSQNRFEIEKDFLEFLQGHLEGDRITSFVEAMAEHEEFMPYVRYWIEASEQEAVDDADEEEEEEDNDVDSADELESADEEGEPAIETDEKE